MSAKLNDLFRGCDFVPPPFGFVSWNEADLRKQVSRTWLRLWRSWNRISGMMMRPIN